jgi:metal-responsive CopG/Arc/MetJ family transcriptional regulator
MKKEKWVVFREEAKLVNLIDEVVERKGIDRSDFIREAVRKQLTELGFFPESVNTAEETRDNMNRGISHGQAS